MLYNVKNIVELAKAFEVGDPIDWGMLEVSEDEIYEIIAEKVLAIISESETPELTATVAMTKLLVENFVLNLQLASSVEMC